MAPVTTSRRAFLQTAGAAAGGLLVGLSLRVESCAAGGAAASPAPVNAYIKVGPDGHVTFIVPKSEMGQGIFTGFAQVLAEELEVDWNAVAVETAPVAPAYSTAIEPGQYTGGSSSVRHNFEVLRKAGAAARSLLISAAAETLGVPAGDLHAARGEVVHAATGRRLPYGMLAARAAVLPAPKDPPLKPSSDWKLIGRSMLRVDSREKVDGRAEFGLDVRLPGLHYAVVERSPSFGGRVASFDPAAAKQVPGVVAVKEVPSGVAVIAKHSWAAIRGRAALKVNWRDVAGADFSSSALAADYARRAQQPGVVVMAKGELAAASGASKRLEANFVTPFLAHAPMEPLNCVVAFSADGCDVYTGTQNQTAHRNAAAEVAGLPPEKIRLHTPFLGGGFGRRLSPDWVREAVAVAKGFGTPVMTVWTREDDIHGGYYRPQAHNRLTAALGADGKPIAWTHTQVVKSETKGTMFESEFIDPKTGVASDQHVGASELPYAIPNLRVDVHDGECPVPVTWWRSTGWSNTAFAIESFIDECAHAAGEDPVAYRIALLADQPHHLATLKLAAEKAGWGNTLPVGRARGIAVYATGHTVVTEIAEVSLEQGKPKVHRVVAAVHCGLAINPRLIEQQVESAICFGLSAALRGEVTIAGGRVEQSNFNDHPIVTLAEMPVVEVYVVSSTEPPTGVGEPATPLIAPAVANALYALTGMRVRRLPLSHATFVGATPS